MEIGRTERTKNREVVHRVQEESNTLHTTDRREANWIGHTLRRNCLLEHVIPGKTEVTVRPGRRCKLVLDVVKKTIG
jgi:hypothetical protein